MWDLKVVGPVSFFVRRFGSEAEIKNLDTKPSRLSLGRLPASTEMSEGSAGSGWGEGHDLRFPWLRA